MALIECPECSKSVSDTANNCPSCGYQFAMKGARSTAIGKILLIVAICLGLFGSIVGFTMGNPAFGAVGAIAVIIGGLKLAFLDK